MHNWVNADFSGTLGWFRCKNCGHREHTINKENVNDIQPPAADKKICRYYGFNQLDRELSCEEVVIFKAADIKQDVDRLLAKNDCNTEQIQKVLKALLDPHLSTPMPTLNVKNPDGAILATIEIEGSYRVRETNGVRVEDTG